MEDLSLTTVSTSLSECPSLPSNVTTEVYEWVSPPVLQSSSWYDSQKRFNSFVKETGLEGVGQHFDLVACQPHERVSDRAAPGEADFFFVYDILFTQLPLMLPLSSFTNNVLSFHGLAS